MNMDLVVIEGEEQLKAILAQDLEEWRIFLHPYQRKLVEWLTHGPIKINGAAGTGNGPIHCAWSAMVISAFTLVLPWP